MQCGYSNLPIRPFDSAMLLGSYASSTSPYMLWTAIGTCTEYAAAATTRTHCQQCPSFSLSLSLTHTALAVMLLPVYACVQVRERDVFRRL